MPIRTRRTTLSRAEFTARLFGGGNGEMARPLPDLRHADVRGRFSWRFFRNVGPLKLALALAAPWAMGWHLLWQMRRLDIDDPRGPPHAFPLQPRSGLLSLRCFLPLPRSSDRLPRLGRARSSFGESPLPHAPVLSQDPAPAPGHPGQGDRAPLAFLVAGAQPRHRAPWRPRMVERRSAEGCRGAGRRGPRLGRGDDRRTSGFARGHGPTSGAASAPSRSPPPWSMPTG